LIEDDTFITANIKRRKTFLKKMCETTKLYLLGDILEKYMIGSSENL